MSHFCDIWRHWSENTSQLIQFHSVWQQQSSLQKLGPLKILIGSCTDLNVDSGSCSCLKCQLRPDSTPALLLRDHLCTEFNKNVHVPKKPQHVISATRGWEYFAKDHLWTVFPKGLLWNAEAYSKEVGECQNVLFLRSQIKPCLFSKCLSKHSVKTRWWSFFCSALCRLFKFKNASELSWGKVLLIRVWYREQIMRHGWSVTLTYCYRLFGLFAFSNRHAVLRKL